MLKRILSFFVLCALVVLPSWAELKVDIIAGALEPTSIAIQEFELVNGARRRDAEMMREVIENDLKRTGLFRIVNHDAFPENVKMGK